MSQIKRVEMLCLENDVIGDGYFALEVAQTLREYADALEQCQLGNRACDVFISPRGTRVTVIGATYEGEPKRIAGLPTPTLRQGRADSG